MIYRFTQIISLPDGVKLPVGDAIIIDGDLDGSHPLHESVKDAIAKGLLDESEVKAKKPIKQKTQGSQT